MENIHMPTEPSRTPHILNTSSNLLGICLIILTSLKVLNESNKTIIDEITIFSSMIFMLSCILSFLSMRRPDNAGERLEKAADVAFLIGLSLLFLSIILFSVNIIH
jgi:Ni/Fe-hydrogenase subunit HybB-like protein